MSDAEFEYSPCMTDGKKPHTLEGRPRTTDYFYHEPYASAVREAIENKLGLPLPEKTDIFRGYSHDMLFLKSHGLVIRIGPIDVKELLNPTISQPIGWLDTEHKDCTVAVYKGEELLKNYEGDAGILEAQLKNAMRITGQDTQDVVTRNIGITRILKDGDIVAVPVLIDADNNFNATLSPFAKRQKEEIFERLQNAPPREKVELISHTMTSVYGTSTAIQDWLEAFKVSQPLRTQFWHACKDVNTPDDMPNLDLMQRFFKTCKKVKDTPDIALAEGIKLDAHTPPIELSDLLTLNTPWTAEKEDKIPRFTKDRKLWPEYLDRIKHLPVLYRFLPKDARNSVAFACLALKANSSIAKHLPKALKNNPRLVNFMHAKDYIDPLIDADPSLFKNKRFVASTLAIYTDRYQISASESLLDKCPKDFFEDKGFIEDLIIKNAMTREVHERVSTKFWEKHPDTALLVVKTGLEALYNYLPVALRENKDFMMQAIQHDPDAYLYTSTKVRGDLELARTAVEASGENYDQLPGSLRSNRELFLIAIKSQANNTIARIVPMKLWKDPENVEIALQSGCLFALRHANNDQFNRYAMQMVERSPPSTYRNFTEAQKKSELGKKIALEKMRDINARDIPKDLFLDEVFARAFIRKDKSLYKLLAPKEYQSIPEIMVKFPEDLTPQHLTMAQSRKTQSSQTQKPAKLTPKI